MANPILKSEIIDHEGIVEVLDIVINKAKELEKVLEGTLIEMAKEARELKNEMAKTRASLDQVIPPETTGRVYDLSNAFQGVLKKYSDLESAISSLQITQKNHNDLIKAQKQYIDANGESYNNWAAQYNALKAIMNNLNPAIAEQGKLLQKLTADADKLMAKMNDFQKKSGKYVHQIGDYTRVFASMKLSMNQVIREVPTLGNSLNQFVVAISNNIPILVDSIIRFQDNAKLARKEYDALTASGLTQAEAMAKMGKNAEYLSGTFKVLGKAALGWNVILIAVITGLEFLTKAIDKRRREQQKMDEELKSSVSLEQIWKEAMQSIAGAIQRRVSDIKTLYEVSQDENRTQEERITALAKLKELYPEASDNIEEYIKKLSLEAEAQAVLSEIANLRVKQVKAQIAADIKNQTLESELAKEQAELARVRAQAIEEVNMYGQTTQKTAHEIIVAEKAIRKTKDAMAEYDKLVKSGEDDVSKYGLEIDKLTDYLNNDLIKALHGTTKAVKETKEAALSDYDFTPERIKAETDIIKEAYKKRLAEINNGYDKEVAAVEKRVAEEKEKGTFSAADEKEVKRIFQALLDKRDRDLKRTTEEYEAQQKYFASLKLNLENTTALYGKLDTAITQGEIKAAEQANLEYKKSLDEKERMMRDYQEQILKIQLDYGDITQEEYDLRMFEGQEDLNARLLANEKTYLANRERILRQEGEATIEAVNKRLLTARAKNNEAVLEHDKRAKKDSVKEYRDATIEKLRLEADFQKKLLQMRVGLSTELGGISQAEYDALAAEIDVKLGTAISKVGKRKRGKRGGSLFSSLVGAIWGDEARDEQGLALGYREINQEQQTFVTAVESSFKAAISYANEYLDVLLRIAQAEVDAAHAKTEAAKKALDYEREARANGYANNVQLARKEYEEKLALEQKAIEEKKRLEKIQEGIDTAQQISSLVTATANLWASYSSIPGVGLALAIAATAAMWGSFAAAKIKAVQMANAKTYGEGGMEYIDYGGSHASGHDVDFGRTKDGRPRRIEKGEAVAVINKRNVNRYGIEGIQNIVQALNTGTFDELYSPKSNMYALAFSPMAVAEDTTDLSAVERGIQTLVDQGSVRIVPTPYGRIEYRGNNKRIIRN